MSRHRLEVRQAVRAGARTVPAFLLAFHLDADLKKISSGAPLDAAGNPVDPLQLLPKVRLAATRLAEYVDLEVHVEVAPEEEENEEWTIMIKFILGVPRDGTLQYNFAYVFFLV